MEVEVELYHERNRSIEKNQVAEVTIRTKHPGPVIRAREGASDMKAAIDLVVGKLDRQAMRLKGRLDRKQAGRSVVREAAPPIDEEEAEPAPSIVKTKRIEFRAMDADEAVLQLELLEHDFFVFTDADSGDISVLYKRRDGDYGLIVPRGA
jgi:putative sigma-54 modulation protein